MATDKLPLAEILKLIDGIAENWAKIKASANAESDARRRKALLEACQRGDLQAVKDLLFGVEAP